MGPTLHALCLLALVGLSVAACLRLGGPPKGPRFLIGILLALVLVPLYVFFALHKCDSGDPLPQALLGGGSAVALAAWIRDRRAAALLSLAALLAAAGLCGNYNHLVHRGGLTGNPHRTHEPVREPVERRAQSALAERGKTDATDYAAGWLADLNFVKEDPKLREAAGLVPKSRARALWHSWFTMLFEQETTAVALWYPGGPPGPAASRLEWRER